MWFDFDDFVYWYVLNEYVVIGEYIVVVVEVGDYGCVGGGVGGVYG